ncbi:acyl-CoA thioesterase [Dyella caseinilytica]|uniref:Acyl-CoA thioesterase n=1 Tax=Dyella caseinilytica TaxID=1849581 RepID=A0ABX7GY09_9GAMM|nr:acyl-CoA thioesterase [Dyella caseinilytica]QRN54729.1 acyl-CoA thioesterase [Dyella caseinilytica]GFZ96392.1 4-hydroxybenzoyl-CoA thioesterase [Dyella caseinilytica]
MRSSGVLHATIDIQVPFFDVDSMDVVWHGHYVKYLEVARCALLDDIGHNYTQMRESGYAWPVIDLQLRYVQAARFGQKLSVRADLIEWQNRLLIHYLIQDGATGQRITRASSVQVAVKIASGEMQLVSPDVFTEAVERRLRKHPSTPSSPVVS